MIIIRIYEILSCILWHNIFILRVFFGHFIKRCLFFNGLRIKSTSVTLRWEELLRFFNVDYVIVIEDWGVTEKALILLFSEFVLLCLLDLKLGTLERCIIFILRLCLFVRWTISAERFLLERADIRRSLLGREELILRLGQRSSLKLCV